MTLTLKGSHTMDTRQPVSRASILAATEEPYVALTRLMSELSSADVVSNLPLAHDAIERGDDRLRRLQGRRIGDQDSHLLVTARWILARSRALLTMVAIADEESDAVGRSGASLGQETARLGNLRGLLGAPEPAPERDPSQWLS